jgi:hypothetical protein
MAEFSVSIKLKTQLLQALAQQVAVSFNDGIGKAIHATLAQLYKKLEDAEDWLRADFSLAINLLEANSEWFAAQVANNAIGALKEVEQSLSNEEVLSDELEQVKTDTQKPHGGDKLDLDSLSLVSKDDFEDWLSANMGIKYLEAELGYELHEVCLIVS